MSVASAAAATAAQFVDDAVDVRCLPTIKGWDLPSSPLIQ